MSLIKKIVRKIREGKLKEIMRELLWIYQYGLRYKGNILWYICLGIVGTFMGLAGSVISKYIIDSVTGYDSKGLLAAISIYIFLQLFVIGVRAVSGRISTQIEIKVEQEIRADIYGKIMEADWENLSEFHSGDLLNRVDNDVSSVSASVIGWIPDFITRIFQFAGTFAVICYYDITLAFLALLSAPATLVVSKNMAKHMRTYNEKIQNTNSEIMIFQEESFQNAQLIKSFGISNTYREKFLNIQEKYKNIKLDYNKFSIITNVVVSLIGTIVSVVCFGWGVYRLWVGHITYGTMTLFLQMAVMLRGSFGSLVHMVPTAIASATAAGRLMAVALLPKEVALFEEEAKLLQKKKKGIEINAENISFQYKSGKEVIVQSDFSALPGEIVALIGASGEGKTTLLRILLGLVNVKEGHVTVGDMDGTIKIPVSSATRDLFSYVPQDNTMFFGTIAENMRLVKEDATEDEIVTALKQACAYEFIKSLPEGIHSKVNENGGGFSEGQVQRLAIARALLSQAPVLLFDEATSALDLDTESQILQNIIKGNQKRTLIFTTHRTGVLSMCDKIYKIEQGHIQLAEMRNRNEYND